MTMSLKLAAPLSIASVICNVVLLAIVMHSHVRFSAMQTLQVGGPGRALLEQQSDQPSLQATVARLAQEVDHLQNQFDSRILQVEWQTAEHAASLKSLTASQKWHGKEKSNTRPHASSARNGSTYYLHAPSGMPARDDPTGTAARQLQYDATDANFKREVRHEIFLLWSEMRAVNSSHGTKIKDVFDGVARLRTELTSLNQGTRIVEPRSKVDNATMSLSPVQGLENSPRRRAQGAEPEPEPEKTIGENVKIIKPIVVRCGGPGGTTADGSFDYSRCSDRVFAVCHKHACDGHRRAQAGDGYSETCADLERWSMEVTRVCCDEPNEDCSGGYPHTCSAGCAATFLPFWDDCRSFLGKSSQQFEPVVALCSDALASTHPSLAEQLNVQCTDGTPPADCVPECTRAYHGYLLLLNIDGEDSKLACELHHGLYSWFGTAVRTFFHTCRNCSMTAC